ncbi:MAG: alpha/beta fold hydrolase [Proteobacteria bacterium]|nr:alpha/beta fold hydrolase [Pseudomonadota bacterium]
MLRLMFLLMMVGLAAAAQAAVIERQDGFVNAHGVLIYYESIGQGAPLMILHGGPGSSHGYFLPHLLPLAAGRRLVFIDERGSGRSQRLPDPKGYTLDNMVSDVEDVRVALNLGKIDVLGHSFGGLLAQAYAIQHPDAVRRLILAGTGSSAARIDADFVGIKNALEPGLRKRIEALEHSGIFDQSGAQLQEYRKLADEAEGPYNFYRHPPSWDTAGEELGWDVLREMWVTRSDFHIDGNLKGIDLTPGLRRLQIPTLIIYGDHDLVSTATAQETAAAIAGSRVLKVRDSGHNQFVDQPVVFLGAVADFLGH